MRLVRAPDRAARAPRAPARRLPDVPRQLPDAGPPANSTHVYFKDVIIAASDDSEDESEPASEREEAGEGGMRRRVSRRRKLRIDRQKLIIILVGLPGRGKTFLCNKLMCYLNWCAAAAAAAAHTASLCSAASAAGSQLCVDACAEHRRDLEHTLMRTGSCGGCCMQRMRRGDTPAYRNSSACPCTPRMRTPMRACAVCPRAGWATTRATSTWGSTAGSRRASPMSRTPPSLTITTRCARGPPRHAAGETGHGVHMSVCFWASRAVHSEGAEARSLQWAGSLMQALRRAHAARAT